MGTLGGKLGLDEVITVEPYDGNNTHIRRNPREDYLSLPLPLTLSLSSIDTVRGWDSSLMLQTEKNRYNVPGLKITSE